MKTLLWMKKGKRSDGILCFTTVTSLLAAAALTAALIGYYHKYNLELKQMNLSNVCLTPGCIKAASIILSRLDENVDPCDDFYQFACGEWLKTHHIPDDRSHINVYDEAVDNIDLQLKILWETKLNDTEPSFIRMAKDLYGTCMDIKSIEKAGAEPLKDLLKNLGGWPVVEGKKWDERKFDWLETLISIRKLGYRYNCLVSFYVDIDTRNSSRHIVSLGGGTLGMDSTYLIRGLNDSVTAAYYKKMVKAATLFGADESMAEKELLEALKFEMILANYSSPLEEETNISKSDNNYTVKSLQKMAPQIPWLKYINGFQVYEIHEDETLKINDIEIIQKIADLITRTEKRVIANYILWRQVDDSLMMLSKEWRQISLDYSRVYTGAEEEPPCWRQCLPHFLGIAQNSYYVRHHFEDKTKEQISKLVKYVHKEFLRILDEIDWMDEKTKTHAKAKANNMMFRIGYPEQLLNNTIVMELYQNLTISNDSYFENLLRIYKYVADDYFSKLRKPNDRTNWIRFAEVVTNVNAYYSYEDNVITIPVGWMGNPFFSNDRPNYLNFAGIGSTIGHGITHGFDDSGRQYDKDGNNVNWWPKVTDEKFRKKAQCIIDQYSNYTTETGQNLNGVNSQDENIADNGGLKESYWAYQSWIKDNGPEKLLPGLKYNQNQLFWIGYASLNWCGKFRPEFLNNFIISDAHMTNEFRVIGPLSNLDEFARDFNCLLDSPMNKKHKCQVW